MDNNVLIKAESVSKKFCRSLKRSLWYGMQDIARELAAGAHSRDVLRSEEFWAVNDVSFELHRGECLGLIGRNGAGKTTLLRILNGLIKPDRGEITMRGSVGAMIALGAGFNPILSGRENIYVSASVLGLSKPEIHERIDDIIDFADIREFIDAPVQSYSSGMQVRLGFAVASTIRPDILILDEVLAVGDHSFHAKCYKRVGELSANSGIIFVSHDLAAVSRICHRTLILENGKMLFLGPTAAAIDAYQRRSKNDLQATQSIQTHATITNASVSLLNSSAPHRVRAGDAINVRLEITASQRLPTGTCLVTFWHNTSSPAAHADFTGSIASIERGHNAITLNIHSVHLATGDYTMNIALFGINNRETIVHAIAFASLHVTGQPNLGCNYKMPVSVTELALPHNDA